MNWPGVEARNWGLPAELKNLDDVVDMEIGEIYFLKILESLRFGCG